MTEQKTVETTPVLFDASTANGLKSFMGLFDRSILSVRRWELAKDENGDPQILIRAMPVNELGEPLKFATGGTAGRSDAPMNVCRNGDLAAHPIRLLDGVVHVCAFSSCAATSAPRYMFSYSAKPRTEPTNDPASGASQDAQLKEDPALKQALEGLARAWRHLERRGL